MSPCHPPWELSQWCPLHTVLVPRVTRPPGSSHPLSWPVTTTWHCHDVTLRLCYNVSREAPAEITDSYLSSVINGGLRSNQHHHQHAATRDYWRHWGSVMFIITMSPFYHIFLASGLTEVVSLTPREAPEEGQGQRMTLSPQVECIVTPVTRRTSRQCRYIRGSRGPGLSPGSRRSGSIFTKHLGATNWTWSSFSRWWPPRLSLTQPPSPGCRGKGNNTMEWSLYTLFCSLQPRMMTRAKRECQGETECYDDTTRYLRKRERRERRQETQGRASDYGSLLTLGSSLHKLDLIEQDPKILEVPWFKS